MRFILIQYNKIKNNKLDNYNDFFVLILGFRTEVVKSDLSRTGKTLRNTNNLSDS